MAPAHSRLLTRLPLNDDVIRQILCELKDAGTLMRLRRVCFAMRAIVDRFAKERYNINKALRPFFGESIVLDFRRLQARMRFVLSGSRVIQFFEDVEWADASDLDIYVYPGTAGMLGNFLVTRAGYVYQGDDFAVDVASEPTGPNVHAYNTPYVRRVYKFAKGRMNIDVVSATESPIRTIIHFHSTPVVNGITWDSAFSSFATATLTKHNGMVLNDYGPVPAIAKYRQRGYTIYDGRVGLSHQFTDYLRTGYRFIGDASTWLIKLDVTGIAAPQSSELLQNNSFAVAGRPLLSGKNCLTVTAYEIEDIFFTHRRLATGYSMDALCARFAGMVIHCLSQRFAAAGKPLSVAIAAGDVGETSRVTCWDKLLQHACRAWCDGVCLNVTIAGEYAKFYPLGGTVMSRKFMG